MVKVAVVGATGNVGREMLQTLAQREFPADEVFALASSKSVGKEVSYGEDDVLKVRDLATFDFKGVDRFDVRGRIRFGKVRSQNGGSRLRRYR